MAGLLEFNFNKARELLKEARLRRHPNRTFALDGLQALTNSRPVAKSLLEKGGFKVDMQSMDWQTVVSRRAKKDPANKGGWNPC